MSIYVNETQTGNGNFPKPNKNQKTHQTILHPLKKHYQYLKSVLGLLCCKSY